MNNVCLIGRITKDVEVAQTQNGKKYCRFNVAVNRAFKDANGDRQADFINCIAWNNQAEFIGNYLKKGNQVSLTGSVQTGSYEKDGAKVYTFDILVATISSLEKREDNNNGNYNNTQQQKPTVTQQPSYDVNDDDLPF